VLTADPADAEDQVRTLSGRRVILTTLELQVDPEDQADLEDEAAHERMNQLERQAEREDQVDLEDPEAQAVQAAPAVKVILVK
jgi:hypothetical protein